MKLVAFTYPDDQSQYRLGALPDSEISNQVIDLNRISNQIPSSINEFLAGGESSLNLAREVLAKAEPDDFLEEDELILKAPIPHPGKIICVGLNYRDHALEANLPIPDYPAIFAKYANSVTGPNEPIVIPRVTDQVDYEGELAFVIGRRGKYIPESEAMNYVAGYLAFNDITARDYQMRTSQWTMGKTFDTFAPMGPALVTSDEIPDPHGLKIQVFVNDEIMQDSDTSNLIFTIPVLVSSLSEVMTLEPGDIISTGTPPGVGFARKPQRFLVAGDEVKVSISGLGTLVNRVIADDI